MSKHEKFAKLYETEEFGQILVLFDQDSDDGELGGTECSASPHSARQGELGDET